MKKIALIVLPAVLLSACNSSSSSGSMSTQSTAAATATPTPTSSASIGTATISGGTYSVTVDGRTITLPAPTATLNGQPSWLGNPNVTASAYDGASTKMLAGSYQGESFAGITGTTADPGLSGTATYQGTRYTTKRTTSQETSGPITLMADFANNKITGSASDLSIDGDIGSSGAVTGTATVYGEAASLQGGFYAGDEMNAVFNNGDASGFVQTKKQ